ncbi:hypothetical protein B0H34DRAFT_792410 [Crassisporium funariophilum]|nr:hypothetical protein B0H34DRAFT_792410 [Crassisporium funariophilum]
MADLATVRSEIKFWERSFKDLNGRVPTVDDIKKNNDIADKYKQYKRLSRTVASSSTTQTIRPNAPPSTPPRTRTTRPKDPSSILQLKSRVVESTAPLSTFNPFSPQKKSKGKEKETNIFNGTSMLETRANLFGKAQSSSRTQRRSPALDSSPCTELTQTSTSTSKLLSGLPPMPTSAVSRARKRLRGEPVSPSPNKDKRRRVMSQTIIPRLNLDTPSSDEDSGPFDADSSFVDNSPVKAPMTGRSFSQLFEESSAPVGNLFGVKGNLGTSNMDISDMNDTPKMKVANGSRRKQVAGRTNGDNEVIRKDLFPTNRSSVKRPNSDEEMDTSDRIPPQRPRSPLIPPSPPNSSTNGPSRISGKITKGKAKTSKGRKKAKVDKEGDDDDESDERQSNAKLRVVNRSNTRPPRAAEAFEDDVGLDVDPILGYTRFAAPHAPTPNAHEVEDGEVHIDLPDKLRRVLALQSAASKAQYTEEDQLVKGLLYRRRVAHYDSSKGGEIWEVGEDDHHTVGDEVSRITEGDDDWEGEPVPWEVGEL